MNPDSFRNEDFLSTRGPLGPETFTVNNEGRSTVTRTCKGGHTLTTSEGTFLLDGAKPGDEISTQATLGALNITKAKKIIRDGGRSVKTQWFPIDPAMAAHFPNTDADAYIVRTMTPQRRNEPILFVKRGAGLDMIDGHHRLQRRLRDGCADIAAITLSERVLPMIAVSVFKLDGGVWTKIDPTKAPKPQSETQLRRRVA